MREKMKKKLLIFWTIALTGIGIFSLSIPANKTENLTEKFTTLSREIVNQNLYVPETLENLKKMFTSCAESAEKAEVKTACQERLANYPKLRSEFLPTKLEVALNTGDVQLKKLGEVVFDMWPCWWIWITTCTETGDEYEVNIPKYDFTFRFPLEKDKHNEKALKERNWVQSGNIAIPSESLWRYSQDPWLKDKHLVGNLIGFYSIPEFTGDAILTKVGEEYRKVYQEVYRLRDWKRFYQIQEERFSKLDRNINTNDSDVYKDFIVKEMEIPILTDLKSFKFSKQTSGGVYGIEALQLCHYWEKNWKELRDEKLIPVLPNCREEQNKKRKDFTKSALIYWYKYNPQRITVNVMNMWGNGAEVL